MNITGYYKYQKNNKLKEECFLFRSENLSEALITDCELADGRDVDMQINNLVSLEIEYD